MKRESVCKGGGTMMPHRAIDLISIQDHLARYAFAAGFVKDKIVLDVACGTGYGSNYLFDKGARTIVGGDIFAPAIEAARTLYMKPGMEFLVLDAIRLPFSDNFFDVIVSMETIEHIALYRDFIKECHRVLKPGGVFICSTPNKFHDLPVTYGPDHIHEFRVDELKEELSRFFSGIQIYAQGYFDEAEKVSKRKSLQKRQKRNQSDLGVMAKVGKIVQLLSLHTTPNLYYFLSFLYMRIIVRSPYLRLSQIKDWSKILEGIDEKYKIHYIDDSSLTPRTIIAVAKKS